jgi:hypothetical protein
MQNGKGKIESGSLASDKGYAVHLLEDSQKVALIGPSGQLIDHFKSEDEAWEAAEKHADHAVKIYPVNLIIQAIPIGQKVTVITARGVLRARMTRPKMKREMAFLFCTLT